MQIQIEIQIQETYNELLLFIYANYSTFYISVQGIIQIGSSWQSRKSLDTRIETPKVPQLQFELSQEAAIHIEPLIELLKARASLLLM